MILRTNLATRPFYNTRAVRALLGVLTLAVLAITAFNVIQYARLSGQEGTLGARADQAEAEAARLRGAAARVRAQIDPKELLAVSSAAREANSIIDRRAFSWTDLFTEFEQTLPPDVRITEVAPHLEPNGDFRVSMIVQARRVEDLDAFMDALVKRGDFYNVLPNEELSTDNGLIEAVVDGVYRPMSVAAATKGRAR